MREPCTHQLPDPECLACRALPRLRLLAATAPTVTPPAGEACADCGRPLPMDATALCEWCAGASERRVSRALAAEAARDAAVGELSEEEFREYARRALHADVAAGRAAARLVRLVDSDREEGGEHV